MRKLDIANVRRMIEVVDAGMAGLSTMPTLADLYEEIRAQDKAARAILDTLQNEHGATFSACGDGYRLQLAGIQSSCTAGVVGLLRNWRNAAKGRLIKEGGQ